MKLCLADVAFRYSCSPGFRLGSMRLAACTQHVCTAVLSPLLAYPHLTLNWNWDWNSASRVCLLPSVACRLTVMAFIFPSCLDDLGT